MDLMNRSEHRAGEIQTRKNELIGVVSRLIGENEAFEAAGGLLLLRRPSKTPMDHGISSPAFCMIAQGAKEVLLGDDSYRYDSDHYLITAAALPTATRVTEASAESPYLGVVLNLDPSLVGSVMVEAGYPFSGRQSVVRAFDVCKLSGALLDAVLRLVGLSETPTETARFLRPLIIREIIFRLLESEQGERLRQIAIRGGHAHRIADALSRLRDDFDRPLRVEDVARDAGMSISSFHHHFKAVTAMSPLQFQKRMRLQEARRLMIGESLDAGSAGRRVGYRDISQFTREYRRLFGAPPARDAEKLREDAGESATL